MRLSRAAAVLVGVGAPVALTLACGSRTGLYLLDSPIVSQTEDGAVDSGQPTPFEDAPSLVDSNPPPTLDVNVPDVPPVPACADASDTLIYTVTESNTLLKFNPSSSQFSVIGKLSCPDPFGRAPFSMAVDRAGAAYVLYYDNNTGVTPEPGNIFRVDLNNAACTATTYVAGQRGFESFGMAFVADTTDLNETLFVASDDSPSRLGAINEMSLVLSTVGTFSSEVGNAELTGTGDGRLYAFYTSATTGNTVIGQVDKTTAAILGEDQLPSVAMGDAWAFAFYGGDFYTFTSPDDATSVVTRYDPTNGTAVQVATYPEQIDGAGVSTCAPER